MRIDKVISALPDPLAPNTVYAVRTGAGFDLFISDATGATAHRVNPVKHLQAVGDGVATSFNVDHNFGDRFVSVEVMVNSGDYDTRIANVTRPTVNRVTVTFASPPAVDEFLVLVRP